LQAKNSEMLIECYYNLEHFTALKQLMDAMPDGSPLLIDIGVKFQSVGLCSEGVQAFVKVGLGTMEPGVQLKVGLGPVLPMQSVS
jgi:WD repeat-containing protein 35